MKIADLVVALSGALRCHVASAAPSKPHILLVVADDLGWNDVGFNMNTRTAVNPEGWKTSDETSGIAKTPVIDELAAEGTILESFYVQPLCSPTRATIMTGRTPQHTGIGPDVIVVNQPYGLPAREVLLPELLRDLAGYRTHIVGKWHLGSCHEGYFPTSRGFESFLGYLSGAQGYFSSAGDRNGTEGEELPVCLGDAAKNVYSATLFSEEVDRIARRHGLERPNEPLFLYLAMQTVHNPYDVPPPSIIDVEKVFPNVSDEERRIYMGMIVAMDWTVNSAVESFKVAGLWNDTVLVFSADNGGVGSGSNFPLRGSKVHLWEGGIRAAAFVRGTNSALAPVMAGQRSMALASSVDLLPTFVFGLAGVSAEAVAAYRNKVGYAPLPSDGVDQWATFASAAAHGPREFVHHNVVPAIAKPVNVNGTWSTNGCLQTVDNRTGICHPFGMTGGAIRRGDWKLLVTHNGSAPWGDSVPAHESVMPPKGFTPGKEWSFTTDHPEIYQNQYFLFNITQDPYESKNLAASEPDVFASMLAEFKEVSEDRTAVSGLGWRYGFTDHVPMNPGGCQGPAEDSKYCSYGRELSCMISGEGLIAKDLVEAAAATAEDCMQACADNSDCKFWEFDSATAFGRTPTCQLKTGLGDTRACASCLWGPPRCPDGITASAPKPSEATLV